MYNLRRLNPDDWEIYRAIRLETLQKESSLFTSTYEKESAYTKQSWRGALEETTRAMFALYHGDQCIGLTGVLQWREDSTAAVFIASYIRADHRGKGLSSDFYRARINWAKGQGYKRAVVSHRADNLASKAANQKFGFVFTHSESKTWPDGSVQDQVFYELKL